jgi:hypothetical protein
MVKSSNKLQLKAVPVADNHRPPPTPFITDAERLNLPVVNVRDGDAPVLDVDGVLQRALPDRVKDKG